MDHAATLGRCGSRHSGYQHARPSSFSHENGQPFTGANFDGEGIALTPEGELLISSETEPSIRRFALDGTLLGELLVPDRFLVEGGQAQLNQTFESLSASP